MQYRQQLIKFYQNAGSKVSFDLTGHLPYIKGLGPYETLTHADGRKTFVILPKMQFNNRSRTRFTNIEMPAGTPRDIKRKVLGKMSLEESAFASIMPPVTKECLNGPKYYFENGMRKVEPYFDSARSYISERQYPGTGLNVIDYYMTRFPAFSRKYFELNLANKQIAVNTENVDAGYVLNEGDVLTHLMHKHENDVLDFKVDFVSETDELLVVNKPPSWPIYPIGNYKFNSLTMILMREHGYTDLRAIHRLDGPTSGICIMAKKPGVAGKYQKFFTEKKTKKEYLALVDGKFYDKEIVCEEPLDTFKISPTRLFKTTELKLSKTIFNLISYNPSNNTSLVSCVPVTGRTHQIRLHLEKLGFFIVNDSLYNPRDFGEERTNINKDELEAALARMGDGEAPENNIFKSEFKHKFCLKCQSNDIIVPFEPSVMCLHSHKYSLGDEYVFESSLPAWAENPNLAR